MRVTSLTELYQARMWTESERPERRGRPLSTKVGGDTVTVSEEALTLAAARRATVTAEDEAGSGQSAGEKTKGRDIADTDDASAVVNGARSTEAELQAEINRVEEEIKKLSEQLMEVMNGPEAVEEKIRLSQPVQKRLQERIQDLQNLKAQAKALQESGSGQTRRA